MDSHYESLWQVLKNSFKPAPAETLLNGWFWSGSMHETIGEVQNAFQYNGGATKHGSNQLLFNPFIKMRLFYQIFSKIDSAPLEKPLHHPELEPFLEVQPCQTSSILKQKEQNVQRLESIFLEEKTIHTARKKTKNSKSLNSQSSTKSASMKRC